MTRTSEPLKVLMFMEYLDDRDEAAIHGGIEGRCFYVSRWLRRRHQVEWLRDESGGARWTHAAAASIPARLWFLVKAVVRGLRTDFDVIDSTSSVIHPFAWLLGFLKRKPVVLWYPDVLIGEWRSGHFGWIGHVAELVERLTLKLPVARFIAISESTRAKLIAAGVEPEKIDVVPCGYEPAAIEAVLDDDPPPTRVPGQVAVVNRLVNYKRVDLLIDAVAELREQHPDLHAVVIGGGPDKGDLERRAATAGVGDRFEFTGLVDSHHDVLRTIAESELFFSGSEIEGFGIVLVEAMAFATPYVVTDIPAFHEVSGNGTGGTLFPVGDSAAAAKAIHELLSDPDRMRAAGEAGRTHAQQYTWEAVADGTEAVYLDVVARHRERGRR